jgi:hypothetical protein
MVGPGGGWTGTRTFYSILETVFQEGKCINIPWWDHTPLLQRVKRLFIHLVYILSPNPFHAIFQQVPNNRQAIFVAESRNFLGS